ncbi:acetylglutamate kinase [Lactobacillus ruminis]|nr:acetylglutamate kinase [Ligilactobacillus ruminis]
MRNAGFGKSFNYGQNVKNRDLPVKRDVRLWDLPVKRDVRLRAKLEKQGFARKTRRSVTGKT